MKLKFTDRGLNPSLLQNRFEDTSENGSDATLHFFYHLETLLGGQGGGTGHSIRATQYTQLKYKLTNLQIYKVSTYKLSTYKTSNTEIKSHHTNSHTTYVHTASIQGSETPSNDVLWQHLMYIRIKSLVRRDNCFSSLFFLFLPKGVATWTHIPLVRSALSGEDAAPAGLCTRAKIRFVLLHPRQVIQGRPLVRGHVLPMRLA